MTWRQLGDEKVRLLCESLKLNHKTTTLNLYGRSFSKQNGVWKAVDPSFGKDGAAFIGEMLGMNSSLTKLDLYFCCILSFVHHHLLFF